MCEFDDRLKIKQLYDRYLKPASYAICVVLNNPVKTLKLSTVVLLSANNNYGSRVSRAFEKALDHAAQNVSVLRVVAPNLLHKNFHQLNRSGLVRLYVIVSR